MMNNGIDSKAGEIELCLRQGYEAQVAGRADEAEKHYRQVLSLDSGHPQALACLSSLAAHAGRHEEALALLEQALSRAPQNGRIHAARAASLESLGRWPEALAAYREALANQPEAAELHFRIGNVCQACGRMDESLEAYRQALAIRPDFPAAQLQLGHVYKIQGELRAAEEAYRRVIASHPEELEAYRALTYVRRFQDRADEDLVKIRQLLAREGLDPAQAMHLHFALGKVYDELSDYPQAFSHWQQANRIRRASYEYDIAYEKPVFSRIKAMFDEAFFARCEGFGLDTTTPIFIVGMPRSGTTLVEQILASHQDVEGAGELAELRQAILSQGHFPGHAAMMDAEASRQMATDYLRRIAAYNPRSLSRVTDKDPFNFAYIGMIRMLFPRAKVICCWRDPMDTCLSCYRQFFPNIQRFAYDLDELGQFYGLFADLMLHWQRVLPGFVLNLSYEQLVADQEGQSRRLLAFCDLPWQDECLRFYDNRRSVRTASATQVREPLFARAVGHWRHYARFLEPLRQGLAKQPYSPESIDYDT